MVYSTCAFNPIENEAVVAHLLRGAGGALELVDVHDRLPSLQRRPGLSSWKIMDEGSMVVVSKPEELSDPQRRVSVTYSMLPPTAEEAARFHLDRCLRLMPHLQDTGGFFVAVLRKVAPIDLNVRLSPNKGEPVPAYSPEADRAPAGADEPISEFMSSVTSTAAAQQALKQKGGRRTFKEEPFFALSASVKDELLGVVSDFFGLSRASGHFEYLVTRHNDMDAQEGALDKKLNKVYLLNKMAYNIIAYGQPESSPGVSSATSSSASQTRIISAGIKLFENDAKKNKRLEMKCAWRLQPESLPHVMPRSSASLPFLLFLLLILFFAIRRLQENHSRYFG